MTSELTKRSKRALVRMPADSFPEAFWPSGVFYARVEKVYDGDTYFIGFRHRRLSIGVWLRVLGVDTPETRTRNAWEKRAGLLVKEKVKALLEERVVPVHITQHDKYGGRVNGTLYLDETCTSTITAYLLDKGYAKAYDGKQARVRWTEAECEALVTRDNSVTTNGTP